MTCCQTYIETEQFHSEGCRTPIYAELAESRKMRKRLADARERGDLKYILLHDAQFREGYEAAIALLKSVSEGLIVPKHFGAAIAILKAADPKVEQ